MRIDRVILATDGNDLYADFWPLVAAAWQRFGIRPTLAVIGDEVQVDERLGEVIRFEPLTGVPTGLHAQAIRLLLPTLFPDDVCLLSDIDMLPLNGRYFTSAVSAVAPDRFVVFRDAAYAAQERRFPICYNAARGATFLEIFGNGSKRTIAASISEWAGRNLGWHTDELVLHEYVSRWSASSMRCVKLGHGVRRRIDRSCWRFRPWLVPFGRYYDAHLLRPYAAHRAEIDRLAWWIGIR